MFVVVTLYREWTVGLQQVTCFFCPGHFVCVIKDFVSGPTCALYGVRCLLLLQLHPQPDSLHDYVQEVPERLQWHDRLLQCVLGEENIYIIWGIWGNISHNGKSPDAHHLSKEFQSSQFISRHVSMWDKDWPLGNSWSILDVAAVVWGGV